MDIGIQSKGKWLPIFSNDKEEKEGKKKSMSWKKEVSNQW